MGGAKYQRAHESEHNTGHGEQMLKQKHYTQSRETGPRETRQRWSADTGKELDFGYK